MIKFLITIMITDFRAIADCDYRYNSKKGRRAPVQ